MSTYKILGKMLKLENPPNLLYCVRRKPNGDIYEVYSVFRLKDHMDEDIYTLKETYEILKEYSKKQ